MITRRQFLEWSLYSSVLANSPLSLAMGSKEVKGLAIGSGKFKTSDGKTQYVLSLLDLDHFKKDPVFIPLDFLAHGITVNPQKPHILTLFEKKGPGACEVDIKAKKVLRKITTTSDRYFYGHSAYSKDANIIYSTEAFLEGKEGLVAIRDNKTMKIIDHFPTFGKNPHDCKLINDGKVLVVTNGGDKKDSGHKPNVAYVDIATRKLLDKVEFSNENINAGHLSVSSKMDLIVVSAPRDGSESSLGGISFRPNGKEVITASEPKDIIKKMKSETLSIALHEEKNIVAVTNPLGNIITFWDYKSAKFIKLIEIDNPRSIGLTLDKSNFIVGHGKDARISFIDANNLKVNNSFVKPGAGFSGSHLILWNN